MGQKLDKETFTPKEHDIFRQRLLEQLEAFKRIIERPDFSSGPASFGAELELYLIDECNRPSAQAPELLRLMKHPLLTEELNKFNLEINLSPVAAKGSPFTAMSKELGFIHTQLQYKASTINNKIATIGILPSLDSTHLHRDFITDLPRYKALTKELSSLKGEPFLVDINAKDSLKMRCDEVTLEGANTSFQVHFKVPAARFANLYNAAQLTTPLVLALSGNSPTFLGQRLWQETRIALFKQSIDNRIPGLTKWRQPARVTLGHGWIRKSAYEIFAENVSLYRPLMPYLFDDSQLFGELCLHHGTVWSWNRAVFEPSKHAHLRIEYRYLPAGPTTIDMMANAAFAIGLTQAISHQIDDLLPKIPFEYAEYNFYRAAKNGLEANLVWPQKTQHGLKEQGVCEIIAKLLPLAKEGLLELDINSTEADNMLSVIEKRLSTRQTGSQWQLQTLEKYKEKYDKDKALDYMLRDYLRRSEQGEPVAYWT